MILLPAEPILITPDSSVQGLIGLCAVWFREVCRTREGNLEHVLQYREFRNLWFQNLNKIQPTPSQLPLGCMTWTAQTGNSSVSKSKLNSHLLTVIPVWVLLVNIKQKWHKHTYFGTALLLQQTAKGGGGPETSTTPKQNPDEACCKTRYLSCCRTCTWKRLTTVNNFLYVRHWQ